MTLQELLETNSTARAIYDECKNPKPMTADFCWHQFWHATPKSSGKVGALFMIRNKTNQPPIPPEHQHLLTNAFQFEHPPCKHERKVAWVSEEGVEHECTCPTNYDPEPPTTKHGWESLKRKLDTKFYGLREGMRRLAEGKEL